jgi:FkbM family methyltransferase
VADPPGAEVEVQAVFGVIRCFKDDLITEQLRRFGAHTRPELALLLRVLRAGDRVFDLGAHVGTFAIPLSQRVGVGGSVIAVEGDPRYLRMLTANAAANGMARRIIPVNAILGAGSDRYVPTHTSCNTGATRFVRRRLWRRRTGVPTCSIDGLASEHGIPDVIKVDIEGLELDVLESSNVVRSRRPVLYAEVWSHQLGKYGRSVREFDDLLRGLGYRLFRNVGERNAAHDDFILAELSELAGDDLFDVLAIPDDSPRLRHVSHHPAERRSTTSGRVSTDHDNGRVPPAVFYSCVIDAAPRFDNDALRWFAALTETAGVPASQLIVHTVCDSSSGAIGYLRNRGVDVRSVNHFDVRSPHCNKISAALALASIPIRRDCVYALTDSDIAIARPLQSVIPPEGMIAAKVVDAPNPPLSVFREVFAAADIDFGDIVEPDFDRSAPTIAANLNGGLYVVPGPLLTVLATAWATWAHWLLDTEALVDPHAFHIDQVAMALALASEGIDVTAIPREWNFPIHVARWLLDNEVRPAVLHYHWCVEPGGLISTTGSPSVDSVIAEVNQAIRLVWRDAAPVISV